MKHNQRGFYNSEYLVKYCKWISIEKISCSEENLFPFEQVALIKVVLHKNFFFILKEEKLQRLEIQGKTHAIERF